MGSKIFCGERKVVLSNGRHYKNIYIIVMNVMLHMIGDTCLYMARAELLEMNSGLFLCYIIYTTAEVIRLGIKCAYCITFSGTKKIYNQ